jgi:hypothetical protein
MKTTIVINKADIDTIQKIIEENQIVGAFTLHYENGSGIGYCLDLEFDTEVHGRIAKITIPVANEDNW